MAYYPPNKRRRHFASRPSSSWDTKSSTINYLTSVDRWSLKLEYQPPKAKFQELTALLNLKYEARFHSPSKAWVFEEKFLEEVKQLLMEYKFDFKCKPKREKQDYSHLINQQVEENWKDKFSQLAGEQVNSLEQAKALYRKLCRENHPDLGGDANKMAEINLAWKGIQQQLSQ